MGEGEAAIARVVCANEQFKLMSELNREPPAFTIGEVMPYQATVLPVMIASPGDVHEYRGFARDIIHEWNYINSVETNAVLIPVGWETHSSPELGASPQELINDRILKDCDLLIGIFWTRLGTPTTSAESGTAEEIQKHLNAGKPAMVYFSRAPASLETVDRDQYEALKKFKEWCQSKGLVEYFDNGYDLQTKLRRHLQITVQKNPYIKGLVRMVGASGAMGIPSVQANPPDPRAELALSLTEEARILLVESAVGEHGVILKIATLGGRFMQINGKTFGEQGDRRSAARWERALNQLVAADLVIARGNKDQVFEMTDLGYQIADYLSAGKQ